MTLSFSLVNWSTKSGPLCEIFSTFLKLRKIIAFIFLLEPINPDILHLKFIFLKTFDDSLSYNFFESITLSPLFSQYFLKLSD